MPAHRVSVVLMAAVGLTGVSSGLLAGPAVRRLGAPACDGQDVDPWVTELRDRVEAYNGLARFAQGRFGPPIACEGKVTAEFDGVRFGSLVLGYSGGVALSVETMPPETSIVVLSAAMGFDAEPLVVEALRAYALGVGLRLDWTHPEVTTTGDEVSETFWDPESGLNASASLIRSGGVLRSVRLAMAL
ncbi:MAG TPA: hypothetical protein VJ997_02700 [Longimicrobiales bacterium]|nr:hypothetical protein [Longimicrobiales bacterium]